MSFLIQIYNDTFPYQHFYVCSFIHSRLVVEYDSNAVRGSVSAVVVVAFYFHSLSLVRITLITQRSNTTFFQFFFVSLSLCTRTIFTFAMSTFCLFDFYFHFVSLFTYLNWFDVSTSLR